MGGGEPFDMLTVVHAEHKFHFECDVRTIITHDLFSLYLVASCIVTSDVRRSSRINYRVSCIVTYLLNRVRFLKYRTTPHRSQITDHVADVSNHVLSNYITYHILHLSLYMINLLPSYVKLLIC